MNVYELENKLKERFELPVDKYSRIQPSKYLNLAAIVFSFKNLSELKKHILSRCLEMDEKFKTEIKKMF